MTKQELLDHIADTETVTASDVAHEFDVSSFTAGMALLRLTRQGLLSRYLDSLTGGYWYRLTERGIARLDFLESNPTGDTYGP